MEKHSKLVSIIVPCYNQALYLSETLDSVVAQSYDNWECIIVNDGSSDDTEIVAKKYCSTNKKFKYFSKDNTGISDTRNFGIKKSCGEYILPLDADDKIGPSYIEKAIDYFEVNPNTKLVYSEAEFFGDENGKWNLGEYKYENLLLSNDIFCSCIYKRKDFDSTCGYNKNMKYGLEDWDFLLSLLEKDDHVYRIPEILFFYRIKEVSRNKMYAKHLLEMQTQLIFNHPDKYRDKILEYLEYCTIGIDYKKLYKYYKTQYDNIISSKAFRIVFFFTKLLKKINKCLKL